MVAVADELRFYIDESILGVGKALAIVRRDTIHPGHPLIPEIPTGTLDPDWMPFVANREWVVIARDKRIRTKPVERDILRDHSLRVFWIAGKHDLGSWQNLQILIRSWDRMEETMATRGPGPWFFGVSEGGLKEIPV